MTPITQEFVLWVLVGWGAGTLIGGLIVVGVLEYLERKGRL